MNLSIRAKDAIKTAMAMTIVYRIALYMNWERPYWAAFAVAFISLSTIEQSLKKGALRMLGTFVAGAVALTLIALFPQQRWAFILMLSIYAGICTYLMTESKMPYFYQVSAFVCAIICFDGGANSLSAFRTTVARVEETAMGIIVYSLIAVFVWPRHVENISETNKSSAKPQEQVSDKCITKIQKRILPVIEIIVNLWIAYLVWIYFDPPGHGTFVAIALTINLLLVNFPSIPASSVFIPAMLSCIYSGILYIFIMPHLYGFAQLGTMIFIYTFSIAYYFHKPQHGLARAFGLAFFATLTGITNQQSYSFAGYANSFLMIVLILSLVFTMKYLIFNPENKQKIANLFQRDLRKAGC